MGWVGDVVSHVANEVVHFIPQGLGLECSVVAGSLVNAEDFFSFGRLESLEVFGFVGSVFDGDGAGCLFDGAEFPPAVGPLEVNEPPEGFGWAEGSAGCFDETFEHGLTLLGLLDYFGSVVVG